MKRVLVFLLLLLSLTAVSWAQSNSINLPFFYLDATTDTILNMSQNRDLADANGETPYPIAITVTLIPGDASGPTVPFNVSLSPHGVTQIPLRPYFPNLASRPGSGSPYWGNGSKPGSLWGSIRIALQSQSYPHEIRAVNAEVASIGMMAGLTVVSSETGRPGESAVGAVVRKTAQDRLFLILQDDSGQTNQTARIRWNGSPAFTNVWVPPLGSVLREISPPSIPSAETAGHIMVETGDGWPIVGSVITVNEYDKIVSTQPLGSDVAIDTEISSPPLRMGPSAWSSRFAITNLGDTATNVFTTFTHYIGSTMQTTNGALKTIAANTTVIYTSAELGAPATNTMAVHLQSGHPVMMSVYQGHADNPRFRLVHAAGGVGAGVSSKHAVGFLLGDGASDISAIIGGTNVDPSIESHVFLVINYIHPVTGQPGRFASVPETLPPHGHKLWDIRGLRDGGVLGADGQPLPPGLTTGSAHMWSSNPTIIGQDSTYSRSGGWAFQCASECGRKNFDVQLGPALCFVAKFPVFFTYPQKYAYSHSLTWPTNGKIDAVYHVCPPVTFCGQKTPVYFMRRSSLGIPPPPGIQLQFVEVHFLPWYIPVGVCLTSGDLELPLFNRPC